MWKRTLILKLFKIFSLHSDIVPFSTRNIYFDFLAKQVFLYYNLGNQERVFFFLIFLSSCFLYYFRNITQEKNFSIIITKWKFNFLAFVLKYNNGMFKCIFYMKFTFHVNTMYFKNIQSIHLKALFFESIQIYIF